MEDCREDDRTDAGLSSSSRERRRKRDGNDGRARTTVSSSRRRCAIRLPPGNRTGCRVLREGRQRDGKDHRQTLATVVAVGPEDGLVCARDRVVFWVRCVPALVPRAAVRARVLHNHRTRQRDLPGVGVGPPVVRDRPSLHVRLVPQVQESGRQRVTPG